MTFDLRLKYPHAFEMRVDVDNPVEVITEILSSFIKPVSTKVLNDIAKQFGANGIDALNEMKENGIIFRDFNEWLEIWPLRR